MITTMNWVLGLYRLNNTWLKRCLVTGSMPQGKFSIFRIKDVPYNRDAGNIVYTINVTIEHGTNSIGDELTIDHPMPRYNINTPVIFMRIEIEPGRQELRKGF